MKTTILAATLAATFAGTAGAATFSGYNATSNTLYAAGDATVTSFPGGAGQLFSNDFLAQVDFNLPTGGAVTVFSPGTSLLYSGDTLLDFVVTEDPLGLDEIALLFALTIADGGEEFAIATFTGDLDGFGGFYAVGAFDIAGSLEIVEAVLDTPAVPLPAGLPLLVAGLGSLVMLRRRGERRS